MKHKTTLATVGVGIAGLMSVAVLLSACGGGGGGGSAAPVDPPVAGSDVPLSATTSSAAALAFVRAVAATSDNTATPIMVGDATLATSDTDEPDPGI
jgi:hypothetical protein